MYEISNIHLSLDDVRTQLNHRWNNVDLRKQIEDELGEYFMPQFKSVPRTVSFRQICTPDHGFFFFNYASKYVGAQPLVLEYHDDLFVSLNEEKKGLGRLRIVNENGACTTLDILDFHENERKKLSECKTKQGVNLVDFHHELFKVSNTEIELLDNSKWFKAQGSASDYYYNLYLHYVAHGVAFENLFDETESGINFLNNIVEPAIERIYSKYNLKPLIARQYPTNQNDAEDFYWWSYPSRINDYIIKMSPAN